MDVAAEPILSIRNLNKTYADGFQALKDINLDIHKGEIIALLGPNGAGKTTLISAICGIVRPSSGQVTVAGFDIVKDFRKTRSLIGLVPQELTTDAFESVWSTLAFSRGLFGKAPDAAHLEEVLRALSLWDKKDKKILTLSGGMKRRLMIAKALSHQPSILFLDEPTAGVDVSLRKDMWNIVNELKDEEVTIILTTHYIEEAEEIADRIGIINNGELILVQEKASLMSKLGKKQLHLDLAAGIDSIPEQLSPYKLELTSEGNRLIYTFDTQSEHTGITALLDDLNLAGIRFRDLNTTQRSLEDIFVNLVNESSEENTGAPV
ncbi:MAG: ABC transporter ATP-binding protein [Proteobacteria bacterium]|nr:ABC transporter ATP-binding protein [Pseudomonadota bacterium]